MTNFFETCLIECTYSVVKIILKKCLHIEYYKDPMYEKFERFFFSYVQVITNICWGKKKGKSGTLIHSNF